MHQLDIWLILELEAENSVDLQEPYRTHTQSLSRSSPAQVTFNRHGRRRSAQSARGTTLYLPPS